jgi:hypothetical protein
MRNELVLKFSYFDLFKLVSRFELIRAAYFLARLAALREPFHSRPIIRA